MRREEIKSLTGFRFLAAFFVFVFHVHTRWPLFEPGAIANIFSQGAVGMTMFFMLSGFILAYNYGHRDFSVRDFLWSRFARIYPIYAVAALLALPWLSVQLMNVEAKFGAISTLAQVITLVIAGLFMLQAWIPMMFGFWNNNASWSLSTEAFFYFMFTPVAFFARSADRRTLTILIALVYCASLLPIISYYAFENRPTHGLQIFYAMPIFRLPEFIIGVGVYFLWFGRENQAAWLVTLLLTIATALWLSQVGGSLPLFMAHNWLVIPAVGAALVHFSSSSIGTSSRILGSGMLVWLGRISYCFYSFQYHSLAITSKIDQMYAITSWQKFALSLTILLLISVVAYHFIEVPARRWLLRCKSSPASAARQAQAA